MHTRDERIAALIRALERDANCMADKVCRQLRDKQRVIGMQRLSAHLALDYVLDELWREHV